MQPDKPNMPQQPQLHPIASIQSYSSFSQFMHPQYPNLTHQNSHTHTHTNSNAREIDQNKAIAGFQSICKIEIQTKQMMLEYCAMIQKISKNDKLTNEQLQIMILAVQRKYESIMGMLQSLPTYDQRTVQQYQKQVLAQHQHVVKEFQSALNTAMLWKQQIHTMINQYLEVRGRGI